MVLDKAATILKNITEKKALLKINENQLKAYLAYPRIGKLDSNH